MDFKDRYYVVKFNDIFTFEDRHFGLSWTKENLMSYISDMKNDFRANLPIYQYAKKGLEMIKSGKTGKVAI